MSEVTLHARGKTFGGWQTVEVKRSMEALASDFSVGYAEKWDPDADPSIICGGDTVIVKVDGDVVISGYVDEDGTDYDATSHTLNVNGRSKTGDLVDCSVLTPPTEWNNTDLLHICQAVCKPFGISASLVTFGGPAFEKFAVQPGETAFECLNRAARQRGNMLFTTPAGNLQIIRSTAAPRIKTVLELGVNVLRGSRRTNVRERHSQYIAFAQVPGTDQSFGSSVNEQKRTTNDAGVKRYRPLVIMSESPDANDLQQRVNWERNTRQGRCRRLTYTVQGWRHDAGVWSPNTVARVKDYIARVDSDWLIVTVRLLKGEEGETTELELAGVHAFDVEPWVEKANPAEVYPS